MNTIICTVLVTFVCTARTESQNRPSRQDVDPDIFLNISQLIASKGFPVEEHAIQTPDGYIIGVQRIPHGSGTVVGNGGLPVLLHHGIFSCGADFVSNFANQSLGFVLADSGYDVWITNTRGNKYSKKHISLSPKSPEFWRFSWDEMALVDLPTVIDYVLNATGQAKLFYVGHSMGTTTLFALLSEKPEYNAKINIAVAMAPVVWFAHTHLPLRLIGRLLNETDVILEYLGHGEFLPNNFLEEVIRVTLCQEHIKACFTWEKIITGMSKKQLNMTRVPVYISNGPDGTSVHTVIHYGQTMRDDKFQMFDFGAKENMIKYNQQTPPEYVLERITTPIALMWGLGDQTADPVDVNLLALRLKNLVLNYQVPDPEWSHDDFAIGLDANRFVYPEILKLFRGYLTE